MRGSEGESAHRLHAGALQDSSGGGKPSFTVERSQRHRFLVLIDPSRDALFLVDFRRTVFKLLAARAEVEFNLGRRLVKLRNGVKMNHLAKLMHQHAKQFARVFLSTD